MTHCLVCFAVKEESRPFEQIAALLPHVQTLLTGMGARNAETAIRKALSATPPRLVLTCGFAGGLRPGLASGAIVFESAGNPGLEAALSSAGAERGRFHCANRVAVSAQDKRALL